MLAGSAAGRKDGCRRPSGHRERADTGFSAALRRGVRGAGRRARTDFQGLELCPSGTLDSVRHLPVIYRRDVTRTMLKAHRPPRRIDDPRPC